MCSEQEHRWESGEKNVSKPQSFSQGVQLAKPVCPTWTMRWASRAVYAPIPTVRPVTRQYVGTSSYAADVSPAINPDPCKFSTPMFSFYKYALKYGDAFQKHWEGLRIKCLFFKEQVWVWANMRFRTMSPRFNLIGGSISNKTTQTGRLLPPRHWKKKGSFHRCFSVLPS